MTVANSLEKRVSIRAFLDKPVSREILERIFEHAQQAPSNCNTQPWQAYIVSGKTRDLLKEKLTATVMAGNPPNPDFDWRILYEGVLKERQYGAADTLYGAMGIERSDKIGRQQAMLRNFSFFDAPHAVFFVMEKYLGIMGAVDMGVYAQSLALLMAEEGIGSCMQGALGMYPDPVHETLNIPEGQGVLFGMSFGYADPDAPANRAMTDRVALPHSTKFFD